MLSNARGKRRQTWNPGSYMELKYETFVADPAGCLGHIYEICELGLSEKCLELLRALPRLENMNNKYLERPEAEIDEMNKIMGTYTFRPWLLRADNGVDERVRIQVQSYHSQP